MGDEQRAVDSPCITQSFVVERRHDRLACAGGHHDQVAPPVMHLSLDCQRFEDFLLVTEGAHIEGGQLKGQVGGFSTFGGESLCQPLAVALWEVCLEGGSAQ